MSSDSTPPLSEFTVVAANAAQNEAHLAAQFVVWHRGRDFETFKRHEEARDPVGWGKDGQSQAWVLVRKTDLEGDIHSACASFRRRAFIKRKGSSTVQETILYSIRSVVTPVQHHKRGYARHLLKLLHYIFASPSDLPPFPEAWGSPPPPLSPERRKQVPYGLGAFLYSDVGPTFYEKCTIGESRPGYIVEGPKNAELVWKVLPSGTSKADNHGWEYIYESDLSSIIPELSKAARARVQNADSTSRTIIEMDPANNGTLTYPQLQILWSTEDIDDTELRSRRPFGVRLRAPNGNVNADEAGDAIVLIAPKNIVIGPRVLITLLHNVKPDQLPSLLTKLDEFGDLKDGGEGWIWGLQPSDEIVKAWQGIEGREVKLGQREGLLNHLLGVAWYGPEEEKPDFLGTDIWNWC